MSDEQATPEHDPADLAEAARQWLPAVEKRLGGLIDRRLRAELDKRLEAEAGKRIDAAAAGALRDWRQKGRVDTLASAALDAAIDAALGELPRLVAEGVSRLGEPSAALAGHVEQAVKRLHDPVGRF